MPFISISKPSEIKSKATEKKVIEFLSDGFKTHEILLHMKFIVSEKVFLKITDEFRQVKNKIRLNLID